MTKRSDKSGLWDGLGIAAIILALAFACMVPALAGAIVHRIVNG